MILMNCEHENQHLCRRMASNGVEHFVMQCLTCGAHVRAVRKDSIDPEIAATLPEWSDAIRDKHDDQMRREREAFWNERREEYAEYLQSPEWRKRRDHRLFLDDHTCQAQLPGCYGEATEVHHLSYRFIFNEPLWDLVSVCRHCHHEISVMEGRIPRVEAA